MAKYKCQQEVSPKKCVLLVDEDKEFLKKCAACLEQSRNEFFLASDKDAALKLLFANQDKIDLVFIRGEACKYGTAIVGCASSVRTYVISAESIRWAFARLPAETKPMDIALIAG